MKVSKNENISVLEISGQDRVEFLNNIFTNDVSKVSKKTLFMLVFLIHRENLLQTYLSDYKNNFFILCYSDFTEDLIKDTQNL